MYIHESKPKTNIEAMGKHMDVLTVSGVVSKWEVILTWVMDGYFMMTHKEG